MVVVVVVEVVDVTPSYNDFPVGGARKAGTEKTILGSVPLIRTLELLLVLTG